ncbi:MAG: ferredoxin [Thaumarchaeota archaeon]|nr:ferredoxin [Nitrososphaerota archaeon]
MAEKVRVKVFRFNPEKDEAPYYKTYEVPVEGPMSVLALLRYIYEELDPTLAFCGEHICYKGICATCMALVNGKVERTCMRIVNPGEEIVVEPLKGQPIVRDLMTDAGKQIATKDGVFTIKRGVVVEIKRQKD